MGWVGGGLVVVVVGGRGLGGDNAFEAVASDPDVPSFPCRSGEVIPPDVRFVGVLSPMQHVTCSASQATACLISP